MKHGRWYLVLAVLAVAAGLGVAWQTWPNVEMGQYDPVSVSIALVSLAVGLMSLVVGIRSLRYAEIQIADAARGLASKVADAETKARLQLLGGHDRHIDVAFKLVRARGHNAAGAAARGSMGEVVDYYRALSPSRMIITGAGGAGKTVLAIELILGLLERRAEDAPVPVRLSASSLDTSGHIESAVRTWLLRELRTTYVSPAVAEALVEAGMVMPVIDGLDEMDATDAPGYDSAAARVLRACNAFLGVTGRKGSVVVTCRTSQYQALEDVEEWLHEAARIELRPVGSAAARKFLTGRVTNANRWKPVLEAMRRGGNIELGKALSTPWRLTLAATVYEQRDEFSSPSGAYRLDPKRLTESDLDTENKIAEHLLGLYIPAVTARSGQYRSERVHRWLATLARYLTANTPTPARPSGRVVGGRSLSGTDLVPHELWPLAGNLPRVVTVIAGVLLWPGIQKVIKPLGNDWDILLALSVIVMFFGARAWPPPRGFDLRRLKVPQGLRKPMHDEDAIMFIMLLAVGVATGMYAGQAHGLVAGLAAGLATVLGFGLSVALANGLVFLPGGQTRWPGSFLRGNILLNLTAAPAFALASGLTTRFVLFLPPRIAVTSGLVAWLGFSLVAGQAGWRYAALLLCTRRWSGHWLPWRLLRFLDWGYRAGLLRIAGIGYQFRHRELQEYLTRTPTPP